MTRTINFTKAIITTPDEQTEKELIGILKHGQIMKRLGIKPGKALVSDITYYGKVYSMSDEDFIEHAEFVKESETTLRGTYKHD